jgi:hypothetical protein
MENLIYRKDSFKKNRISNFIKLEINWILKYIEENFKLQIFEMALKALSFKILDLYFSPDGFGHFSRQFWQILANSKNFAAVSKKIGL